MTDETTPERGSATSVDWADEIPPARSGVLRYEWTYYAKAVIGGPLTIPSDATRELLGVYKRGGGQSISLQNQYAPENAWMEVPSDNLTIELRRATHGPAVCDAWTIDSPSGGGECTILTISRGG